MTERELVLGVIEAMGGSREFWANAPSLAPVLEKAAKVVKCYHNRILEEAAQALQEHDFGVQASIVVRKRKKECTCRKSTPSPTKTPRSGTT